MYYGLRQYEALHRLWWFVFFLLCLFIAWYSYGLGFGPKHNPDLKDLGKAAFWTDLQGVGMDLRAAEPRANLPGKTAGVKTSRSAGSDKPKQPQETSAALTDSLENIELVRNMLLFIIKAGMVFLELRLFWLLIQYAGRYLLQAFMSESEHSGSLDPGRESTFPVQVLFAKIKRNPLTFVLHPFIRLRLILSGFQKYFSSEELFEKERRVVESDWRILYGSWGPYRCLIWVLPAMGLAQTILLLIAQFNGASAGLALLPQKEALDAAKPLLDSNFQKELLETVKPALNLLLPLIQAAGLAVFFQLAATLLRYLEELYLSNLDMFIYDRLLSKLPLQSNDTVLILESLQHRFKELESALKRVEDKLLSPVKFEEHR